MKVQVLKTGSIIIILLALCILLTGSRYHNVFIQERYTGEGCQPVDGFVPDSDTAQRIAEAVLIPVYGSKVLEQRPFKAKLYKNEIWIVQGSKPPTTKKNSIFIGGLSYVEIRKRDGAILKMIHFK